jgi:cytochrome P450
MRAASPFAHLPGRAPTPLLGRRGNVARFFVDPIAYMAPLPAAYGSLVPFVRGGGGPVMIREATAGAVFAFGPACMQAVLTQTSVFHSARVAGPPESDSFVRLTSGLFSMNEDKHRRQRRSIQPAFHRARLESYHATMVALTDRTLAGLRVGEPFDPVRALMPLTLAIANKTLFGLDTTAGAVSVGERIQAVITLAMSPGTFLPRAVPFTARHRLVAAAARVEQDLRAVIGERRTAAGRGDDVVSTLLSTHDADADALTEDELVGQLFILFLAGHDTTKAALAWTLLLLVQHPHVLADVLDELRAVLGGTAPTPETLARLPLLERVIKESLRLFPSAPFTGRVTTQATLLGGVELPARTEVFVSPYCLHRDPALWPDPLCFRPARWESIAPSPFEYAPFGAGPRMCIGAAFARLELQTVLAMLLQRFGLALAPGARVDRKTTIVLSPRRGVPLCLRPPGTVAPATHVRGNVHEMVELP